MSLDLINSLFAPIFANCTSPQERYNRIIELGKRRGRFDEQDKQPENKVQGCQSLLYLSSSLNDGKLNFKIYSDALISAGLAQLLVEVYSGESPSTVIENPPTFLQEWGILQSLTPGRANGVASLYLKMKVIATQSLANI